MNPEAPQGDYVLVPAKKAKISRARKGIIGMMVMGAVVALGGAGSFASFTAETTNDATFSTARLVLSSSTGSGTCFSAGQPGDTATQNAANTDTNRNTGCDALFPNFVEPGNTSTAGLELSNENSTIAGALAVYTDGGCVDAILEGPNAGSDTLCDDIQFKIQRADATYTPQGAGDASCVYPTNCVTVGAGTLAGFAAGATGFAAADTVVASFGDSDNTEEVQHVLITMALPHGADTDGAAAGCAGDFVDELSNNGTGCDNVYMDREAQFNLIWRLVQG